MLNAGITIITSRFLNISCSPDAKLCIITFAGITGLISTLSAGEQNILCSRKFLFDAIDNPTAICTVQGTQALYMSQHLNWKLVVAR